MTDNENMAVPGPAPGRRRAGDPSRPLRQRILRRTLTLGTVLALAALAVWALDVAGFGVRVAGATVATFSIIVFVSWVIVRTTNRSRPRRWNRSHR